MFVCLVRIIVLNRVAYIWYFLCISFEQEKTTYGRLRVLTAPPTSVHEMAGGVTTAMATAVAGATGSETTSER